jgi:erythrocyte band 7 integral membrane protein
MFDPSTEMNRMEDNTWQFMDTELNKPFEKKGENGAYKACLKCCGGI